LGKITRSQSGQAIVEYILLLSLIIGGVGLFISKLTGSFDQMTAGFGGKVEQQIRTGSITPSVWQK
jgi:Flp pilus assembly pilin Flp